MFVADIIGGSYKGGGSVEDRQGRRLCACQAMLRMEEMGKLVAIKI